MAVAGIAVAGRGITGWAGFAATAGADTAGDFCDWTSTETKEATPAPSKNANTSFLFKIIALTGI